MVKYMRILYFGLDPSRYPHAGRLTHLPLIRTEPYPFEEVKYYFHLPYKLLLFTSRIAVSYFFSYYNAENKPIICVGNATADRVKDFGRKVSWVAEEPCGEGVINLLDRLDVREILYPHSKQARPLIPSYLKKEQRGISFPLYKTVKNNVILPDFEKFDRIVFTSPSTVDAFHRLCPSLPPREKCEAIGPVTQNALNKLFGSTILQNQQTLKCEDTNGKKIHSSRPAL